jgi:hypothetical protein
MQGGGEKGVLVPKQAKTVVGSNAAKGLDGDAVPEGTGGDVGPRPMV